MAPCYGKEIDQNRERRTSMNQAVRAIRRFIGSDEGPTAVEYAVLVGLIIVALIGTIQMLTGSIDNLFAKAVTTMENASK